MLVSLNGINLWVPIGGGRFSVPESFAAEIYRRIAAVDAIELKQTRVADAGAIYERTAGDIRVFG
jgi:hypothetical protein